MIPKVSYALEACGGGGKAAIVDGRVEHALVNQVYRFFNGGGDEEGGTVISVD